MDRKSIILDRQKEMFRIALDPTKHGMTLKMIASKSDLGLQSVRNYAAGETEMSVSAYEALIGVLPDDLLSLMLPDGHRMVIVASTLDFDAIAAKCHELLSLKTGAHHPGSPAQRDISECEHDALAAKVAELRALLT